METPIIEIERLILKRGKKEDYLKVYEYDLMKLRNINGEFIYEKLDPSMIEGFDTYADTVDKCLDFIIYLKDNNEPIGNIVFDRYNEKYNSLEIAYNLHPNYWKKGIMTEAVIESMKYVFNNYDFDNIIFRYALENVNSKALNERIGFEYLGQHNTYYKRYDKDIVEIETIISKEKFNKLYINNVK